MEEVVTETDVLIIGGGGSGLRAAIEADEQGVDVLIVDSGLLRSGSITGPAFCAGVGPWSNPKDSWEEHFKDLVVNGRSFIVYQELARILAKEAPKRMLELENFGHVWDRNLDGSIRVMPFEPHGHSYPERILTAGRVGNVWAWSGKRVTEVLSSEVIKREIDFFEETPAVSLLTSEGSIAGAMALNYSENEILIIKAKSTVLTTGSLGAIYFPHNAAAKETTGGGLAMALRAGAQLSGIELVDVEIGVPFLGFPPSWRGRWTFSPIYEWKGHRPRLYNAKGERFMKKYYPEKFEADEKFARYEISHAVRNEIFIEGNGTKHDAVFLGLDHMPPEILDEYIPETSSGFQRDAEMMGKDLRTDKIEVSPVIYWSLGGVKVNTRFESTLKGLYAAGDTANFMSDVVDCVANGLTGSLVSGKRAGEYAAKRANQISIPDVGEEQIERERERIYAPLTRKDGTPPSSVRKRINEIMWKYAGVVKNEDGLKEAREKIEEIREKNLPKVSTKLSSGKNNRELYEALELRDMVDVALAVIEASLMRKESRGSFFNRSDYPEEDEEWLKHIIIEMKNGKLELKTEPVEFPYLKPK